MTPLAAPAPTLARPYQPGLHVLATFAAPAERLRDAANCHAFFGDLVRQLGLTCVGEAWHTFEENQGCTVVLVLTESPLSIHTWPEHGLATFDVFCRTSGTTITPPCGQLIRLR